MQHFEINHSAPIGHEITEQQKQAFIKKNCFYCKALNLKMTKSDCDAVQLSSLAVDDLDPLWKCRSCKRFDQSLITERKSKKCEMETEWPGFCVGDGVFYDKPGAKPHEFVNKHFCSLNCGSRYNRFKRNGWKTEEDLPKRIRKTKRVL